MEARAPRIIDATCPRVAKVQAIIRRWAAKGYATLIVGDADHPEVEGLMGHTEGRGHVLGSAQDVAALPELGELIVVAQTTQSEAVFEARVAEIKARFPKAHIFNTHLRRHGLPPGGGQGTGRPGRGPGGGGRPQQRQYPTAGGNLPGHRHPHLPRGDRAGTGPGGDEPLSHRGGDRRSSTPHWLIGNVVSTLKHAWAFRPGSWINYLYRAWRFSLKSNLYVATGAGSLSYVSSLLQQVEPQFTYFFVAFFYVYAMHLLNHFTDKASKLNDPVQTMFYGRHRLFFLSTGALSACLALVLGAYLGWLPFVFILIMSGIGLLYNFKIIPDSVSRVTLVTTLKEIPGSKAVFTAVAWGVLAALIPVVCSDQEVSGATAIAFFFVAGMIFIRSGLFEIMAIEGDRVVGKETLAIALGKERALNLLSGCPGFVGMLLLAAWAGIIPSLGYLLSLSGLYALGYLTLYRRGLMESGLMLESLVEGNMILAGILAFIWDPYNTVASFWFSLFG